MCNLLPVSHLGTGPISDRTKCIHFCVGFVKKGSSSAIPILKHSILKIKQTNVYTFAFYSAICAEVVITITLRTKKKDVKSKTLEI